jgi:hypothetical protein
LLGSSSTKDESSEENLIWKHEIGPLIETLITAYKSIKLYLNKKTKYFKNFFVLENHFDQFDRTGHDLYNTFLKNNLFGKKTTKKRGEFLKTLFNFIESENSIVRFHVARLSLAVRINAKTNQFILFYFTLVSSKQCK